MCVRASGLGFSCLFGFCWLGFILFVISDYFCVFLFTVFDVSCLLGKGCCVHFDVVMVCEICLLASGLGSFSSTVLINVICFV